MASLMHSVQSLNSVSPLSSSHCLHLKQGVNLGLIPFVAMTIAPALRSVLDSALVDGIVATMCLPTSINMCVVLTQSAGGAVSSSLFNAAFGEKLRTNQN